LPAIKLSRIETAEKLGVSAQIVFKSIVVLPSEKGKPILGIIPVNHEIDLKAVAIFFRLKKVQMATQVEAERLTGLQTGGISPLALVNKGFRFVLDETAQKLDELHISGGQRGLNIRLPVKALIQLFNIPIAPISVQIKDDRNESISDKQ
jgi:Cys-tRNA(Pro)/Cys-tRNA(Cys) deacylase